MATIGRTRAVAWIFNKVEVTGILGLVCLVRLAFDCLDGNAKSRSGLCELGLELCFL